MVVDVQYDYAKQSLGDMRTGEVEMAALEATMRTIGERVPPDCLVVIETTVAPGTKESIAYPIMKKAFAARGIDALPLLAHSYERVMPGREYVASIRDFWRVCSGCNDEGREGGEVPERGAERQGLPLTVMNRPIESESRGSPRCRGLSGDRRMILGVTKVSSRMELSSLKRIEEDAVGGGCLRP